MYKKLAKYYDLIYHWKDYQKEADSIKILINKYLKSNGNQLLDVGCGTGKHLEQFKDEFICTGIDINNEMVEVARSKIEDVNFYQGDMVDFSLDVKFDIILCLFSAIGYVKTYARLEKTLKNFVYHLNKGGVLVIEPWFTKSVYKAGKPGMTTYDGEEVKLARVNNTKIEGNISVMDMHYLIAERNADVIHYVDTHELGLFEIDKTLEFMEKANLQSEYLENGLMKDRGLYIGVRL